MMRHAFVTSQGGPYSQFKRALGRRNFMVAWTLAAELPKLSPTGTPSADPEERLGASARGQRAVDAPAGLAERRARCPRHRGPCCSSDTQKASGRTYWTLPDRQIESSVPLARAPLEA
jgi:hypothetical protein